MVELKLRLEKYLVTFEVEPKGFEEDYAAWSIRSAITDPPLGLMELFDLLDREKLIHNSMPTEKFHTLIASEMRRWTQDNRIEAALDDRKSR